LSLTDTVLCAFQDRAVLQSWWNTAISPPWQFPAVRTAARIQNVLTDMQPPRPWA